MSTSLDDRDRSRYDGGRRAKPEEPTYDNKKNFLKVMMTTMFTDLRYNS